MNENEIKIIKCPQKLSKYNAKFVTLANILPAHALAPFSVKIFVESLMVKFKFKYFRDRDLINFGIFLWIMSFSKKNQMFDITETLIKLKKITRLFS